MTTKPKPIPDGYHTVTPYLFIRNAAKALDFYKQAFGATEMMRMAMPDGKVMHAEIKIGDSMIMLAEESPKMDAHSPDTLGGTSMVILLYLENVDARFNQAVAAGAKVVRPLENYFYGDRSGTVADPFGHRWTLSTHIEDVDPQEVRRRAEAFMKKM